MTIKIVYQIAQRSAVRSILFPKDGMAGGTDTALGAGIPACDAAEGLVAGGEGVAEVRAVQQMPSPNTRAQAS